MSPSNRLPRISGALLVFALLSAVAFWFAAAMPYLRNQREGFGPAPELFWDRRYGLWIHILGGTIALFVGPVQLWLGQTRQRLPLHRLLGTTYLASVVILCAAAYYLALTTPAGFVFASGLFSMSLAATVTTALAYLAIRYRNFVQHREWMIRSYVVIFSFVVFRMIVVGLAASGIGGAGQAGDILRLSVASWSSWAIPLLVTELCLQWPKLRPARQAV